MRAPLLDVSGVAFEELREGFVSREFDVSVFHGSKSLFFSSLCRNIKPDHGSSKVFSSSCSARVVLKTAHSQLLPIIFAASAGVSLRIFT